MPPNPYYYSTQSALAHTIQTTFYDRLYVYIAEQFDPVDNEPTSNPCRIADRFCRIMAGDPATMPRWEQHKTTLLEVALTRYARGRIDFMALEAIQTMVTEATLAAAAPLVYVIPRQTLAPERLHPDDQQTGEAQNIEHVLVDLQLAELHQLLDVECATLICRQTDGPPV
jgi:hypothetical protein